MFVSSFLPRSREDGTRLAPGCDASALEDREPFTVEGLRRFALQSETIERARRGERLSLIPPALAASGKIPPRTLGDAASSCPISRGSSGSSSRSS